MDAQPLLMGIARALRESRLEAVLIGNAAAAIGGIPVTTLDFDFMVRDIEKSKGRIAAFAKCMGASVVPSRSPLSRVVSVVNEERGLYVDFLDTVSGVRSFASLRSRAVSVDFGERCAIRVAALKDLIASKRAVNRPKDRLFLQLAADVLAIQKNGAAGRRRRGDS